MSARRLGILAIPLLLLGFSTPSAAASLDIQRFHLVPDAHGFLGLRDARTPPPGQLAVNLGFNYGHRPLNLGVAGADTREAIYKGSIGVDLTASVAPLEWLEIGAVIPVVSWGTVSPLGSELLGIEPRAFSMGDMSVEVGFRPLDPASFPVGVQIVPRLIVPTGGADALMSMGQVGLGGDVVVSGEHLKEERLFWAFNLGLVGALGEAVDIGGVAGGSSMHIRAGVGYRVVPDLFNLSLELRGFSIIQKKTLDAVDAKAFDARHGSWELLLQGRLLSKEGFDLFVGGGPGLSSGYGTPRWRVLLGITAAPERRDRDGDGFDDEEDACPEIPEDMDGFEDSDGCPELDNDGDGVKDADDGAPDTPEDPDGFEDEDGVPDEDNDGDGLLDAEDGAPNHPEDEDGFQDDDGVPDPDNDQDGVLDEDDECPIEAETFNNFEDEDGCPEPDTDGDGFVDPIDDCPEEPEVFNGIDDDDGCPDESLAVIQQSGGRIERINILDKVYFDTGKSTIKKVSYPVLDAVVQIMVAYPEITGLEIQGHTDNVGSPSSNETLSRNRADAVLEYLVAAGIERSRLSSQGYGQNQPIADNGTADGRSQNRRVEFLVTAQEGVGDEPEP